MANFSTNIKLETKLVGSIQGDFYIPSYQRGYRWGSEEVTRLLDDVNANGTKNYCLQPVVVHKKGNRFELIDGQQRLTTLYLIYKYMHISSSGFLDEPRFTLAYETREKSKEFLDSINKSQKDENIDFWFMCNAYETIEAWFASKDKKSTLTNINKFFDENVKIIWYEVDETEDAIALFARLNIGKIPLTSAELVKAMFLSRDNSKTMDREKQEEISLQWDNIEKDLHNDSLWYFLTNKYNSTYQTRIDLVLDLIASKPATSKDKYYTFFYFDELKNHNSLDNIWAEIQHTFLVLKDWYENHEFYHKIGYLIASGAYTLQAIYVESLGKTKSEFKNKLDDYIRKSIKIKTNYAELSYEKSSDYASISRLLLLFNVESVCQIDGQTQRFPFDQFKYQNGGKVVWSLEHIHAQQSEGMQKQEQWKQWLQYHIPSIEACNVGSEDLVKRMKILIDRPKLERNDFEQIQNDVVALLSAKGSTEYLHSISNLALLNTSDNAALNNSTFDVKRNEIIKMDKAGQYIPFCTKMVFLKYYTPSAQNQLQFWGPADRIAYVKNINRVLDKYLGDNKIIVEQEVE